jgi:hypothetical protein
MGTYGCVRPYDILYRMIDNLREEASSKPFFEEEAQFKPAEISPPSRSTGRFFGMTPMQRFIVSLMLMFAVCALGAMCLLITQKIGLPT